MSYTLDGTTLRSPQEIEETNSTQYAQQRTLDGSINRDYFGSNKKRWVLRYHNTKKADFDTINTIYAAYLATGTTKAFASSETNYTISSTNCHIDLTQRGFRYSGIDYLSDFDLILTED
jgi:hypothetical protein